MISRWAPGAAAVVAALLVLTACGDDPETTASDPSSESSGPSSSESSPSETPTSDQAAAEPTTEPAAPLPECSEIWVDDGRKLPAPYRGCSQNGTDVPADSRSCSFGQALVVYGNHFYAVPRGPINRTPGPLAKDRDYRGALASCTA